MSDEARPLDAGVDVGRFRVRRVIGEGGMGRVYLARDQALGRQVALKVVRADRLTAEETQRVLEEARITARFAHPHIVTIYEVGEHGGTPYLALEYLDGESLQSRLAQERLGLDAVLRIGAAIADALVHAHAAGVRHGDLKPGNVMLPRDGRVRVVDFGLATELRPDVATAPAGTLAYMAPEQWRSAPVTDRADVWALATLLVEAFTGAPAVPRPPAEWRSSPAPPARDALAPLAVPPAVVDAVEQALSVEPAARPSAADLLRVLQQALERDRGALTDEAPFRGLLPFDARHAHTFFGRDRELDEFLARLREEPVLLVVGPSGVGKTSFVHAGVLARQVAQERTTVVALRPGGTPLRALALALHRARRSQPSGELNVDVEAWVARLRATPTTIALDIAALATQLGGRVVLVIDQLEELFTHEVEPRELEAFLIAASCAAQDPREPSRVVLTLRDDFIGRWPGAHTYFALAPLGREALAATVLGPLRRVGYGVDDPHLIDRMLDELHDGPAQLPLLQFACRCVWDARDEARRMILVSAYEHIGGVAGALAVHAEALLASLDDADLHVVRQILLRLVGAEGTRRLRGEAEILVGLGPRAPALLQRLGDARLIVIARAREGGPAHVELAHEALITQWDRLAAWLDDARDERRLASELEAAAQLWARRGRRSDETWTGEALATIVHRARQLKLVPEGEVARFLGAGEARERARLARRRRGWTLGALALVAITVVALALAAEFKRREAVTAAQNRELLRASANLGAVTLTVELFDWDAEALVRRPHESRSVHLRLHEPSRGDPEVPGEPIAPDLVRVQPSTIAPSAFDVEAPGGVVFVAVHGRGREGCAPSWTRVRAFPGYADRRRDGPTRLHLRVPSCQASTADMVEVPAGEFVFGGAGDEQVTRPDGLLAEEILRLPAFRLDRTEVTNAQFAPFAEQASLMGADVPRYPDHPDFAPMHRADHPVTGLNAREAGALCAYYGKRLPTLAEWVKATRGGLVLPDGRPNPRPRRSLPGGRAPNLMGAEDGCLTSCSVREGRALSPYGAVDLVGNASEWVTWPNPGGLDDRVPLAGGGWATSPDDQVHTTAFPSYLERRFFDFQTGARCALGEQGGVVHD